MCPYRPVAVCIYSFFLEIARCKMLRVFFAKNRLIEKTNKIILDYGIKCGNFEYYGGCEFCLSCAIYPYSIVY